MLDRLVHRGPDGHGIWRENGVHLGHRRLSILDLEGGAQPMRSPDGRYTLTFNGEIFNAPELRRSLEAAGIVFRTHNSDTEVLLHLLIRDGLAALPHLAGMFSFALWDAKTRTLLCARDPTGIKPFYFTRMGNALAFASEAKALLALDTRPRAVAPDALFHYLSLMYVPAAQSAFDGIQRLQAGHCLRFSPDDGALSITSYWRPDFTPDMTTKVDEWPEKIAHGLEQAVMRWTLSDVPIACSLSGGLDSSAVVGVMARKGVAVRTYSLGFSGTDEEKWNELPLAAQVAERWGTDHHEIILDPGSLIDALPAMAWHLDEPYGGGLPSWAVFKAMGADVKVAMTGTGGDELFGNYGKWTQLERNPIHRLWPGLPSRTRFTAQVATPYTYWPDRDKRRFLGSGFDAVPDTADLLYAIFRESDAPHARDRIASVDLATQLPEEFLAMTDRFSMAHSIEARTPFLDPQLIRLVQSIPARHRTRRNNLKGLLRQALKAADLLPPDLVTAPKKGFTIPLGAWMRGRLRPYVLHLLSPERLGSQGILSPDFHQACVLPHLEGRADYTTRLWGAFMMQLWIATFIDRDGSRPLGSLDQILDS